MLGRQFFIKKIKKMETELINLIGSNLIGVLFGILMYRMANTTIKDNSKAINELVLFLKTKK